jgi:Xaa-Pro aminopeptidase
LAWLENELVVNDRKDLNEYDAALKLCEFRKQQELFMGESFETISSSGIIQLNI